MIPTAYNHLARLIHEERIAAAKTPRPDWVYQRGAASPRQASRTQHVRRWLAAALIGVAARLEPEQLHRADQELSADGAVQ